ncbi:MbcA/ParS/Xre antitoxin family protein [Cupriavidus necator]|uniref:MbcA/ParS/Xre antitoxin family protein n=1 Tax=Cupriavidus necator TaxID=106590 RepID=UPI0005B31D6F|nr:MbcA/ParS/Xre antitoxin family protein [Cupriavidus necator]
MAAPKKRTVFELIETLPLRVPAESIPRADLPDNFAPPLRIPQAGAMDPIQEACAVFGDRARALTWLSKPLARLGGSTPLQAVVTEDGGGALLSCSRKLPRATTLGSEMKLPTPKRRAWRDRRLNTLHAGAKASILAANAALDDALAAAAGPTPPSCTDKGVA